MKKIKILYTLPYIDTGGAEVSLYDILRFIDKDTFDVTFIALQKGQTLEKQFDEIPNIKIIKLNYKSRLNPMILIKLITLFRKIKPDIVHSHLPVADIYSRIASLFIKTKMLSTFHACIIKKNFFWKMDAWTSRLNDWMIANSEWTKNLLIKHNYLNEKKMIIIPLGIDFNKFTHYCKDKASLVSTASSPLPHSTLHLVPKAKLITFVGSFKIEKGQRYLLEAIKILHQDHPDYYFFFAGKGQHLEDCKKLAIDLGIEKNAIFTGVLDNVGALLERTDLYVSPSLTESQGIALIEAMYYKIPIIAFDVDAVPEIVIDNVTGWLVKKYDIIGLAKTISKVMSKINANDPKIEEIVNNAYKLAIEKFSIEKTVKNLENFYHDILFRKELT